MKKTTKLRDELDRILLKYIEEFEQKHEVYREFSVSNDLLQPALISDCFFQIQDIIYDIDNNVPDDLIFDWYWEQVEKPIDEYVNFDTYCKYYRGFAYKNRNKPEK